MTEFNSSALVNAADAGSQIAEALRNNLNLKGVQDVSVETISEESNQWLLHVSFAISPKLFGFIPLKKSTWSFYVSAVARHSRVDGVVVTDSAVTGEQGALYTIWTILDCQYLWYGSSFPQLLERIAKIK